MGRVISFAIRRDEDVFSESEKLVMREVTDEYNSGQFENVWTCENFFVDPDLKIGDRDIEREVYGFVKVQGNEFNSLLVYTALLELSVRLPAATIDMQDEGEFLLCDIHIKQGKVLPRIDNLVADMDRWAKHLVFGKKRWRYYVDARHMKIIGDLSRRELQLPSSYEGIAKQQLNQVLDRYTEVVCRLESAGAIGNQLFHYNIAHRKPDQWFDPEVLCRTVDPADYRDYVSGVGTVMDGFNGEGFGMTDEDSERKSYEVAAFWQTATAGDPALKLEILPKLSN